MKKMLLYVEDDPVQASLVQPLLEDEGFSVFHAHDGSGALSALAETRFDLVLTDYSMPLMNGVELLQQIRLRQYDVPVVVMTAFNDVSLAFAALKAGADDFIAKDKEGDYLTLMGSVLTRAMRQYTLQAEAAELAAQLAQARQISYQTLDSVTQGVLVVDKAHRIIFCNRYLRRLLEVGENEPLTQGGLKLLATLFASQGSLDSHKDPREIFEQLTTWLDGADDILEATIGAGTFQLTCTLLGGFGYAITLTDISQQKAQLSAMATIITLAPVAMLAVNMEGTIELANQKACELIGLSASVIVGTTIQRYVPRDIRDGHQNLVRGFFQNPSSRQMRGGRDVQLLAASGNTIPVEIALNPVDILGACKVVATIVDISHRKEAEQAMQQAHQLTQSIIDNAPFSIMVTDQQGKITAVSPALETMLGYGREELILRRHATDMLGAKELESWVSQLSEESGEAYAADFNALVANARKGIVQGHDWTYIRKDGSTLPVNMTITSLRSNSSDITGYLLVAYDITEQKRAQAHIEHAAHHDGLTGLPNRSLMLDRLNGSLRRMRRYNRKIAVIMMDLDHFKQINDTLGHHAGDQLLITVAERLRLAVRESDTVCRIGGDEFVAVLPDMDGIDDAQEVCRKILKLMKDPVSVGLHYLNVTPSIGLSIAPDHGTTAEELLKHADAAMYQAKQAGRNGFKLFSTELGQAKYQMQSIEAALQDAIVTAAMDVCYQPQVEIATGKILGFEALLRWDDPMLGNAAPEELIRIAEATGHINALGDRVLDQACSDLVKLREVFGVDIYIAVNIASRQFERGDFVETVRNALSRHGLDPTSMELELSETLLTSHGDKHKQKLAALSQLGVRLTIRDFGTGQTSLTYIAHLPISAIKIQRQFLDSESKVNSAIVRGIAAIANGLKINLVAVGVESKSQLEFARKNSCLAAQGGIYTDALTVAELINAAKAGQLLFKPVSV